MHILNKETLLLTILSSNVHANIPMPIHWASSIPVSKEAKEEHSHCMDEAQNFAERKSCDKQLIKRLAEENEKHHPNQK